MSNKKRESGYYWVKVKSNPKEWVAFEYEDPFWLLGLKDKFFSEINEERIINPDEPPLVIINKPQQPGHSTSGLPSWVKHQWFTIPAGKGTIMEAGRVFSTSFEWETKQVRLEAGESAYIGVDGIIRTGVLTPKQKTENVILKYRKL
tara:strand:- start:34 stop:474 length:441 start_codon:yes stop_codon:yes gene_type:complete